MNSLIVASGASQQGVTMSSREIAELVEARHNDVVTTIDRLFSKGLLRSSRKTRREATGGRPVKVYDLIERDTHLVVAGYSDEHRARVIDRWQELEQKMLELANARASRQRARLEAPFLTDAVKYNRLSAGKDLKPYHFSNEFDLINRVVLGCSSKQYRAAHGLASNDPLRDTLTPVEIKAVEHMQRLNASLIDVGMAFDQRKAKLHQVFMLRHQRALMNETMQLEA